MHTTSQEISAKDFARAACAVEITGEVKDLRTVVGSDCEMNILTAKDSEGLRTVRHTCSYRCYRKKKTVSKCKISDRTVLLTRILL